MIIETPMPVIVTMIVIAAVGLAWCIRLEREHLRKMRKEAKEMNNNRRF